MKLFHRIRNDTSAKLLYPYMALTLNTKPLNKRNVPQKINNKKKNESTLTSFSLSIWMMTLLEHDTANNFLILFCIYHFETQRVTLRVREGDTAKSSWSHFLRNHSTRRLAFHVANPKHVQTPLKPQCSASSYCK